MDAQSRRFGCYFITVILLTLIYALSPSRETRIRVSDPTFKQVAQEGENRQKFKLSLALEEGKTYRIEEATRHTATTRNAKSFVKNTYEVLAETEYLSNVVLDLKVTSVRSDGKIHCRATMVDFMGYEELRDESGGGEKHFLDDDSGDDDQDEAERQDRNKQMFAKVREETKGDRLPQLANGG